MAAYWSRELRFWPRRKAGAEARAVVAAVVLMVTRYMAA
jgi:hypothetical protein